MRGIAPSFTFCSSITKGGFYAYSLLEEVYHTELARPMGPPNFQRISMASYFLATVLVSSPEETRKVPGENVSEYTQVVKRFDFR